MCGISGFCAFDRDLGGPEWSRALREMNRTLAHRGPDDQGSYLSPHCGLAHRRLAVIDPKNGAQPMYSGDCVLVYNGELMGEKLDGSGLQWVQIG